ncbi:hypothetical protein C5167_048722, partial [Papaver somniferum]
SIIICTRKKLILYSCWGSSCSWRVRFALHLKELPYEYRAVDLKKGEQFSSEFDRLNPLHFVPVMVHGDLVITDSFAILMYLEEKYPQNALLPNDLKRKAINFQAVSIVSSSIQPLQMMRVVNFTRSFTNLICLLKTYTLYTALEQLLKGISGRYAIGDEVHMADVFLAPQIGNAMNRFKVNMVKFPTLSKMYESCKVLPAFQACLPERQPDAVSI